MFEGFTRREIIQIFLGAAVAAPVFWAFTTLVLIIGG